MRGPARTTRAGRGRRWNPKRQQCRRRVASLYLRALSRPASEEETREALAFLASFVGPNQHREAWARAQGFTPLIERRADLKQMLTRVAELAPDLDEAGAERELGKLYSALPAYAGGDLKQARAHFEAALARVPSSARTRIVFARTVGVKAQDRALFEAQLQAASSVADEDLASEAKELLAREDDLFGPAEAAQPIPGGPTR